MNSADADDQRACVFNNTALAMHLLGECSTAETYASKAIELSGLPNSHKSAVVRLLRELNLIMILVGNKKYSMAKNHAMYIRELANRFPSRRTEGTARLCEGLTEVYLGDPDRGLTMVEEVAASLKGVMVPLYLDSLSQLARLYGDLDRPEDALRVLRELLAHARSVTSESVATQLRALGVREDSVAASLRRNLGEHERVEAELRVRVAEREVSRSRHEMLERMAIAADIREDISGEHGYRVGRLSALLAREIGWDRDACNALDIAARLHDIGKIGIPEKILLDEKTLKEAEKHFIASHTIVGAEILSKSDIPQVRVAEEIARCHHEWWDGTGYPRQFKGMSIPKSARIVALADAFDAMTHGRPYAKAIATEAALDQISALRGRQFDPELTDHFLALVRRLATENADLDAYLGKAARNSPFLKARARIKEMLAQGRDSAGLSSSPPPLGTPLN
ncbi:MAG: HD domain-containing protein [Betaproteobacteria bacterium]|nr:HD domain-containing protein [Betaproteobacteria bacterium]